MQSNLLRFFAYLRPYRKRLFQAFGLAIIGMAFTLLWPQIGRLLIDGLPNNNLSVASRMRLLYMCTAASLLLAIGGAVLSSLQQYLLLLVGQRVLFDLRQALFRHLQKLSLRYYETRQTGRIFARVMYDVDMVQSLATSWVNQLIVDILMLFGALFLIFFINWKLALIAIIAPPLYLANYYIFARPLRWASLDWGFKISEISGNLQEKLAGVRVVKSFTKERAETRRFISDMRESMTFNLRLNMLSTVLWQIASAIAGIATAVIWLIGGISAIHGTGMSVGDIAAFVGYVGLLYGPLLRLSQALQTVQTARAAIDRIFETLDTIPDVQEKENAITLSEIVGEVEFRDVYFGYSPDELVLKGVSFKAKPGTVTAVVGPSGGGKTTLVNLIPRFYDPLAGQVLIDGIDLRDVKINSLRQQIGIVLQETFLFSGTLRENIKYGRDEATDDQVVAAAQAANAHDFITELKYGYDTDVGERGIRLSGGQKQRIAIARAILRDPKVLILDEATSLLDSESEAQIQAALEKLMKGRTTFVIAHRLSTVMHADQILVIEDGQIVERGTHDELVRRGGRYARLVELQFKTTVRQESAA